MQSHPSGDSLFLGLRPDLGVVLAPSYLGEGKVSPDENSLLGLRFSLIKHG